MKNPNRRWKYWRISRKACGHPLDQISTAKREAPNGYTLHDSQPGQFVFRKRLPAHTYEAQKMTPAQAKAMFNK